VRTLLKGLDVARRVISVDAIHTQKATGVWTYEGLASLKPVFRRGESVTVSASRAEEF